METKIGSCDFFKIYIYTVNTLPLLWNKRCLEVRVKLVWWQECLPFLYYDPNRKWNLFSPSFSWSFLHMSAVFLQGHSVCKASSAIFVACKNTTLWNPTFAAALIYVVVSIKGTYWGLSDMIVMWLVIIPSLFCPFVTYRFVFTCFLSFGEWKFPCYMSPG